MRQTRAFFALPLIALVFCCAACIAAEDDFVRRWTHTSETSAVIYWQLPRISMAANSVVEYGATRQLGQRTEQAAKPRWAQLHRLTGLTPGQACYYRMVNIDPETGERTESEVLSLTPRKAPGAVYLPGGLDGPPFILDRPGAHYVLTDDVVADGTAFIIRADSITLDLDGHDVVFGNDTAEQVYGVRFGLGEGCRLVNGRIVQGRRSDLYSAAIASLDRPQRTEICGISTDVHLKCAYPVNFTHSSNVHVHHNHIYSRVTEIECRHYPGNVLLRFYVYDGGISIHDNLLTEGCHWGIMVRERNRGVPMRDVEVAYNDIRHHQQYVNGYALAPGSGADVHHNRVTSTGRAVHVTGVGTLFHDNYIDTRGHMHLSDLPARTRPFHHRLIELHGVKFEGRYTRNSKVYNNFVRITQPLPTDSGGRGDPRDKMENGVYIRANADELTADRLVDNDAGWEIDRWRWYWVRFSDDHPPVKISGNDSTFLFADFPEGVEPGEYTIYMKWTYVPPTPLNIACYDPNGMNEVYGNEFVGITHYENTRHGDYGDSGEWATGIMFVGMNRGPAEPGKYSVYIHDNRFESNDLFINSYTEIDMDVRIENNTFELLSEPLVTEREDRIRAVGEEYEREVRASGNTFDTSAED